jgi:microcompartment protein CcmL/EutN
MMDCLGLVECRHLSVSFVIANEIVQQTGVRLLGLEPDGTEGILIRLSASAPDLLSSALEVAEDAAGRLGGKAFGTVLARPDPALAGLNRGPKIVNGIYGGREEFRPEDCNPNRKEMMSTNPVKSIGILETQGLTAILEATDAMLKAADVTLIGKEKIGAAYVTVMVEGDVAAVKAAVEAGAQAAEPLGKVIATHVIARPHTDMLALLPGA